MRYVVLMGLALGQLSNAFGLLLLPVAVRMESIPMDLQDEALGNGLSAAVVLALLALGYKATAYLLGRVQVIARSPR